METSQALRAQNPRQRAPSLAKRCFSFPPEAFRGGASSDLRSIPQGSEVASMGRARSLKNGGHSTEFSNEVGSKMGRLIATPFLPMASFGALMWFSGCENESR